MDVSGRIPELGNEKTGKKIDPMQSIGQQFD